MKKEKSKVIFDVDAQLDAAFGKEGTPERGAAEERANAFLLAARIGTNKSYISRVETGRTEPKVSTFYRIIAALGLTVELTPAV